MPPQTLDQHYPLSPRKFWKKMLEKFPAGLLLLFITGVPSILGLFALRLDATIADVLLPAMVIAVLVSLVLVFLYAWYVKAYIRRYYYDANENFVTIKKVFLHRLRFMYSILKSKMYMLIRTFLTASWVCTTCILRVQQLLLQ